MLTLQSLKQDLRKFYGIKKIIVSVGEYENEDTQEMEYDINVNVWAYNRYYIEEFECFTRTTLNEEKKAITLAKRTTTSLQNLYGNKVEFVGLENC